MNRGDVVQVRQIHADGEVYRWWTAEVESVGGNEISLIWPKGTAYEAPSPSGRKFAEYVARGIFWNDRPYNIVEHYDARGDVGPIYSDICSPVRLEGNTISYTDYELDVAKFPGRAVHVEDEDEFEDAIATYGYTPEFQAECWKTLEEVRGIVVAWVPRGMPRPTHAPA